MQFSTSFLASLTASLALFSGAQAAMSVDQIVGGLNMFRDMAKQLQPAASALSPNPLSVLTSANQANLQQCADGFAQAAQLGGGFVNGIAGTPAVAGQYADDDRSNIAGAYGDCAQSHLLLLKTVANAQSGVGYGTAQGTSIVNSMGAISAVITGLTANLVEIVGANSGAAMQLNANKNKLLNGAARVKACYSPDIASIAKWAEPAWLHGLESPYYNESHRRFQKYVREYVDTHLLPHALEWEAAGEAPRQVRERFAGSGLAFLDVPLEYRPPEQRAVAGVPHEQLDAFHELILMDEMARLPSGVAIALAGASNVGAPPVIYSGSDGQKRRWLPGLFSWQTSFCLAVTEPTAGSDVGAIRTSAVRTPDGSEYVVNGLKKWVTGAPWATHMTTAVRTKSSSSSSNTTTNTNTNTNTNTTTSRSPSRSEISLLVIPLDSPGVSIRKIHNTGHNAGLRDVRVAAANLVGCEGGGFPIAMRNFNKERFILAVDCNRQARVCLAEALRHAHDRETFGAPLASRQLIRAKLTSVACDVEAHWARLEQLAHHVRVRGWQARDLAGPVALTKVQGGLVVERAVRESQQVHGGAGYERGRTMTEQIQRDLRLKVIGGGSEEILTDLAWREEHKLAKERGAKLLQVLGLEIGRPEVLVQRLLGIPLRGDVHARDLVDEQGRGAAVQRTREPHHAVLERYQRDEVADAEPETRARPRVDVDPGRDGGGGVERVADELVLFGRQHGPVGVDLDDERRLWMIVVAVVVVVVDVCGPFKVLRAPRDSHQVENLGMVVSTVITRPVHRVLRFLQQGF
ncbi:uncharacterized protein PpBr36_09864, partial [Pyricularia pennisetigena]|uniref:uncharacterized protein n=1 Tax=Pyricularia pennisetigena TaxID=1578925 RepID=UPI001152B652